MVVFYMDSGSCCDHWLHFCKLPGHLMETLKRTLICLLAGPLSFALLAQSGTGGKCQINGNINGAGSSKAKLDAVVFGQKVSFDATITAGKFEFSINQPSPTAYTLYLPEKPEAGSVTLFCDHGTMEVSAATGKLEQSIVSGSTSHQEWQAYNQSINPIELRMREVSDHFDALAAAGKLASSEDSLRMLYSELSGKKNLAIRNWILNNPVSYVAPFVIALNYMNDPNADVLQPLYEPLSAAVKASYYGKSIGETVTRVSATRLGSVAPSFAQEDPNGKPLGPESYRGKYVLLDFWASWCGPCRQENPNLVRTYEKFRDKMVILGISLDNKKEPWLKAIQDDRLTWPQVSDLKGWANSVALQYGVKAIPANFLLDPDGRIIAKSLRGPQLEQRLSELLK